MPLIWAFGIEVWYCKLSSVCYWHQNYLYSPIGQKFKRMKDLYHLKRNQSMGQKIKMLIKPTWCWQDVLIQSLQHTLECLLVLFCIWEKTFPDWCLLRNKSSCQKPYLSGYIINMTKKENRASKNWKMTARETRYLRAHIKESVSSRVTRDQTVRAFAK